MYSVSCRITQCTCFPHRHSRIARDSCASHLSMASNGPTSIGCPRCTEAIGTTVCFDNEHDAKSHCRSELHTVVCSQSALPLLQEFKSYMRVNKPTGKTNTAFSTEVEWQFGRFRQYREIQESYQVQDAARASELQ